MNFMLPGLVKVGAAGCAVLWVVPPDDVALDDALLGDEIVVALVGAGAVAAFEASAVVCRVPLVG